MLIPRGDGCYMAGPLDVLCILHDVAEGRFHVCFFEESPLSGPVQSIETMEIARLKSKMHHTTGAPDLDGAKAHLAEMRQKVIVEDANVVEAPIAWDGEIPLVWVFPNWRRTGSTKTLAEMVQAGM